MPSPPRFRLLKIAYNTKSSEEVAAFGHQFYEKVCDLNSYRLWGAGFVITGYMSDDSFHYFRSWIVGKGREVFELALANPDDLGPHIDNPEVDNELLEYIAVELCETEVSMTTHATAPPEMRMPSRPAISSRKNPCRPSTPSCPPASPKPPAAAASYNAASPTPIPNPYNQSPPLPGQETTYSTK